jgi:hypothetical protein
MRAEEPDQSAQAEADEQEAKKDEEQRNGGGNGGGVGDENTAETVAGEAPEGEGDAAEAAGQ